MECAPAPSRRWRRAAPAGCQEGTRAEAGVVAEGDADASVAGRPAAPTDAALEPSGSPSASPVPGCATEAGEVDSHALDSIYTCGCGHLGAELLCGLLARAGVCSVLDIRELDHSTKRPWFNSDALAATMAGAGLSYEYVGELREDGDALVARMADVTKPVCLLGVRALARECPRLRLSQRLELEYGLKVRHLQPTSDEPPSLRLAATAHSDMYARHEARQQHMGAVLRRLEEKCGFSGRWQARVLSRYRSVPWEKWDAAGAPIPDVKERPLLVRLPWDTLMLIVPDFLSQAEVYRLQQASLPGAVDYEQPRRQVRNPDGTFTQFSEKHKEAWFCDDYDHRDTRRVRPPRAHPGQALAPWAVELLERASAACLAPLNALMCRWEARGVHLKDGPHTYATHMGWSPDAVIGLLAVGATREYRIHGIPWFYGRGRREVVAVHVPLVEGMFVAIGGPLTEKWLYAQPRDEAMLPERVQFTLQLHADLDMAKGDDGGGVSGAARSWTEDCDGGNVGSVHSDNGSATLLDMQACKAGLFAAAAPSHGAHALSAAAGVAGEMSSGAPSPAATCKGELRVPCRRRWQQAAQ